MVISGKILEFRDRVKVGMVDLAKVVRFALQHAPSAGSLVITTEAMGAERREKPAANDGPPGGGMDDRSF